MDKKSILYSLFVFFLGFATNGQSGSFDPDFLPNMAEAIRPIYPDITSSFLNPDESLTLSQGDKMFRINRQGQMDESFQCQLPGKQIGKIKRLADGRILAVVTLDIQWRKIRLHRFFPNGQLDSSFQSPIYSESSCYDFKILSNGKILMVGHFRENGSGLGYRRLFRLNENGSLDSTFTYSSSTTFDAQELPNGKILAIRKIGPDLVLHRLLPNGQMDPDFQFQGPLPGKNEAIIRPTPDGNFLILSLSPYRISKVDANGVAFSGFPTVSLPDNLGLNFINGYQLESGSLVMEVLPDGRFIFSSPIRRPYYLSYMNDLSYIRLFLANGQPDNGFISDNNNDGMVRNIHPLNNGEVLFTGQINAIKKQATMGIALVSSEGNVLPGYTPFHYCNYFTSTLVVQSDNKILVGGDFYFLQGKGRFQLARLEPNGQLDTIFIPPFSPLGGEIVKLGLTLDGNVLALRKYVSLGYNLELITRGHQLERYFPDGQLDTNFTQKMAKDMAINHFLIQPNGKILISGYFDSIQGIPVKNIARLHPNGNLDVDFNSPNINKQITNSVIALQRDGKILFTSTSIGMGSSSNPIYRLLPNGAMDPTFSPVPYNQSVLGMSQLEDGRILIYGTFSKINEIGRNGMAVLLPDGTLDQTLFDEPNGPRRNIHHCLQQLDGKILATGNFYSNPRTMRIVRYLLNGNVDSTFNAPASTNLNSNVWNMAFQKNQSRIAATGDWNNLAPNSRTHIAMLINDVAQPIPTGKLSGTVFQAQNNDCVQDSNETGIAYRVILAQPGNRYALTDLQGRYSVAVDTGAFSATILASQSPDSQGLIYSQQCPENNQPHTGFIFNPGDSATNLNFSLNAHHCPFLRISVAAPRQRWCSKNHFSIRVTNSGILASDPSTTVWVKIPSSIKLLSASFPYQFFPQDSTYRFPIGSIAPQSHINITLFDSVLCQANLVGQQHCIQAWVTPSNHCHPPSPLWDGVDLEVKARCQNGPGVFTILNKGAAMSNTRTARIFVDSLLAFEQPFQLGSGDSLFLTPQLAGNHVLRMEVPQSAHHPESSFQFGQMQCGNLPVAKTWFSPSNDNTTFSRACFAIVYSVDPNDKQVSPKGVGYQGFVGQNLPMDYTIRFQNTGTDTAHQVLIRDFLDTDFDLASFEPGASSHPYRVSLSGSGNPVLEFNFDNIMLVDSITNPLLSQGYVQYRIWPKKEAPIGTILHNQADIFFDLNKPVRTNMTINTLYEPKVVEGLLENVLVEKPTRKGNALLYPNPADNQVFIWPNQDSELMIFNVLGQRLETLSIKSGENKLDFSQFPRGMYLLKIRSENRTQTHRLVLR